jgi:hypothetical protein
VGRVTGLAGLVVLLLLLLLLLFLVTGVVDEGGGFAGVELLVFCFWRGELVVR